MIAVNDRKQVHPGVILRGLLLDMDIGFKYAAQHLGVNEVTISKIVNQKAGISAAMALRLESFGRPFSGMTAHDWMAIQSNWELHQAAEKEAA